MHVIIARYKQNSTTKLANFKLANSLDMEGYTWSLIKLAAVNLAQT